MKCIWRINKLNQIKLNIFRKCREHTYLETLLFDSFNWPVTTPNIIFDNKFIQHGDNLTIYHVFTDLENRFFYLSMEQRIVE